MGKTAIEWTDETNNIIVAVDAVGGHRGWWCRKISQGCKHCYSEKINQSDYFGGNHLPYSGEPPILKLREDTIDGWARQRKPRRHFVESMSDAFGEWVPQSWIFRFLDGALAAPRQTFQFLTKRSDVLLAQVTAWCAARGLSEVPQHMWIGVSVEDQENADRRISNLLATPAAVRFLSCEPLLGPIDLSRWAEVACDDYFEAGNPGTCKCARERIAWVIVGGESGPKARPCNLEWIRSLVEQCARANVPVFVKQDSAPRSGQQGRIPDELWLKEFPA